MSSYILHHLSDRTREHMLSEFDRDTAANKLFISLRLSNFGASMYPSYLKHAITLGDHETLMGNLSQAGHFNPTYLRQGKPCKMPSNAATLLAHSEFNRFYIRGVCLNAIENGISNVEIYRARASSNARAESEAKIGQLVDAYNLVEDLRLAIGLEPSLLPEINSGLSVRY